MYSNPNPAVYFWRNIEIRAINKLIQGVELPNKLYDLGCGDKTFSRYLFQDKEIIGIDLKGNPDIVGDIYKLDKLEKTNFVFCNSVLEHLKYIYFAVQNISYILNKGGLFLFTVPTIILEDNLTFIFKNIVNKAVGHTTLLYHTEWRKLLESHNLKIIKYVNYLDEISTMYWLRMLILQKITGNIFFNKKKLNRMIERDTDVCFGSCTAFLATKF